jgi:hypothetical protein
MRNLMLAAVMAMSLSALAHAEGACDHKIVGSTSYGTEAAKAGATTDKEASAQTKPNQMGTGSTSYGDEAAKASDKDKDGNTQTATNCTPTQ